MSCLPLDIQDKIWRCYWSVYVIGSIHKEYSKKVFKDASRKAVSTKACWIINNYLTSSEYILDLVYISIIDMHLDGFDIFYKHPCKIIERAVIVLNNDTESI